MRLPKLFISLLSMRRRYQPHHYAFPLPFHYISTPIHSILILYDILILPPVPYPTPSLLHHFTGIIQLMWTFYTLILFYDNLKMEHRLPTSQSRRFVLGWYQPFYSHTEQMTPVRDKSGNTLPIEKLYIRFDLIINIKSRL